MVIKEEKMKVKVCTTCKKEYPATQEYFSRFEKSDDNLFSMCKECKKKSQEASESRLNNRGKRINIRVTEKEKEIIENYAKDSNMNTATYVRNVVIKNAPIIVKDMGNYEKLEKEIEQLSYFLSKIGNNINQISKNLNEGGSVSDSTIKKMVEVMSRLDEKMESIEEQVCSVYRKWQ